jgi:hypothetical protein
MILLTDAYKDCREICERQADHSSVGTKPRVSFFFLPETPFLDQRYSSWHSKHENVPRGVIP